MTLTLTLMLSWELFRVRVGEFLDTFDTQSKKPRVDGQTAGNVRDFLFKDETKRNTADRDEYTLKLPPNMRAEVEFVEQVTDSICIYICVYILYMCVYIIYVWIILAYRH